VGSRPTAAERTQQLVLRGLERAHGKTRGAARWTKRRFRVEHTAAVDGAVDGAGRCARASGTYSPLRPNVVLPARMRTFDVLLTNAHGAREEYPD
jgi:hypothetical protein